MKKLFLIADLSVIFLIFILPYCLFNGKLYISGDDTRLLYVYPWEYLKNIAFFSWHNISTVGTNAPNQFYLPLLFLLTFVSKFISTVQLDYFSFSLPLILTFIYWKKFLHVLFAKTKNEYNLEIFLGSLFFVLSPILIVNQLFIFLSTIWLLPVIPSLSYYFIKFLKEQKYINILKAFIISFIFSIGFFSIPWILGIFLPILIGLIISIKFFQSKLIINFGRKFILFFVFVLFSQIFWISPFFLTYLDSNNNSFGTQILSKVVADTFSPTVLATSTGTILYPLLGLFHRQIAFDFGWQLKNTFLNYYDKTFLFNLIFPGLLIFSLLNFRRYFDSLYKKIFIIFLISFVASLYFFTVNIGPLKDIFLLFGHIPGFVMFRNFYDKFALGYIYFYTIILTASLILVGKKFNHNKKILIYCLFTLALFINFIPIGQIVNAPLWTTKNVYRNISIPSEYLEFMKNVKKNVSPSSTILSIPFGEALYTVIKDEKSNNVYAGTSPVKILSDVNDISGYLSFNYSGAQDLIDKDIQTKNYQHLINFLHNYNINYLLRTKNIPQEVINSWLYKKELVALQDDNFIKSITNKKIITSSKGNYELYSLKNTNNLISSSNTSFKRINAITYEIYIKNIKGKQELIFNDSFHGGWKLIINQNSNFGNCDKKIDNINTSECKVNESLLTGKEINFYFEKKIFDNTHKIYNEFSNKWTIDSNFIKNNYSNKFYKLNKDGSINVELTLYFVPQTYFYFGLVVTILVFFTLVGMVIKYEFKKNSK